MSRAVVPCPYCRLPATLVGGAVIYPHRPDLAEKRFYACLPCGAWVGCHPGTDNALGRLANAELRAAKQAAHAAFDPIWTGGQWRRKDAYKWLAEQLEIDRLQCHIGMFDVDQCRAVVRIVAEWDEALNKRRA